MWDNNYAPIRFCDNCWIYVNIGYIYIRLLSYCQRDHSISHLFLVQCLSSEDISSVWKSHVGLITSFGSFYILFLSLCSTMKVYFNAISRPFLELLSNWYSIFKKAFYFFVFFSEDQIFSYKLKIKTNTTFVNIAISPILHFFSTNFVNDIIKNK